LIKKEGYEQIKTVSPVNSSAKSQLALPLINKIIGKSATLMTRHCTINKQGLAHFSEALI
jgi:hypothetical protein